MSDVSARGFFNDAANAERINKEAVFAVLHAEPGFQNLLKKPITNNHEKLTLDPDDGKEPNP